MKIIITLLPIMVYVFISCGDDKSIDKIKTIQENIFDVDSLKVKKYKEIENDEYINKQVFKINSKRSNDIKCEGGTLITFPKNCFVSALEEINITVIEAYSFKSILFNGLVTLTDENKLLETEGMIYIAATDNKEGELLLKENKRITITMPWKELKNKEEMKIFKLEDKRWSVIDSKIKIEKENDALAYIEEVQFDGDSDSLTFKIVTKELNYEIKKENLLTYYFQTSQLGWLNCDRYVAGESQNILVNLGDKMLGAKYYLILNELNSIISPIDQNVNQLIFQNVPIASSFHIVGFGTDGENLFFGINNFVTFDEIINFSPLQRTTKEKMNELIDSSLGKHIWIRPSI